MITLWAALEAEHAATKAGREFSRVPRLPSEWSEETAAVFELAMREYDMMHRRLSAETPEAA